MIAVNTELRIYRASGFKNNNSRADFKGSFTLKQRGANVTEDGVTYYPALLVSKVIDDQTEADVDLFWPTGPIKTIDRFTQPHTEYTFNLLN